MASAQDYAEHHSYDHDLDDIQPMTEAQRIDHYRAIVARADAGDFWPYRPEQIPAVRAEVAEYDAMIAKGTVR